MPISCAAVRLSIVARMAAPNVVRYSSRASAPRIATQSTKPYTYTSAMRRPPTGKLAVRYQTESCWKFVVKTRPSRPSMPSASAYVTSTDRASRSVRSGRMNTASSATPSRNMTGIVTTRPRNGSMCQVRNSAKLRYAPSTTSAPWPTLMIRMTPKISVRPDAMSAYTPPVRTPSTADSRTRSI